jgi:hypothetical protein
MRVPNGITGAVGATLGPEESPRTFGVRARVQGMNAGLSISASDRRIRRRPITRR